MGYGGARGGDIFTWLAPQPPRKKTTLKDLKEKGLDVGTWDWPRTHGGGHGQQGILVLRGPGVKKGYLKEKPIHLADIAPTLCYLWGIPVPANATGAVIWDLLE